MKKIMSVLLVIICMFSYMLVYAQSISGELSKILRLHIIAQSDSEPDQKIKLEVRDYVSQGLKECKENPYSREYLDRIEQLANERLAQLGAPYVASAGLERVYIPKKSYKNITLPSGRYNAVRVVLGRGAGQNWWCVAYPPLCFTEELAGNLSEEGKAVLKEKISGDTYDVITSEAEYRLWIVDLIGKIVG